MSTCTVGVMPAHGESCAIGLSVPSYATPRRKLHKLRPFELFHSMSIAVIAAATSRTAIATGFADGQAAR
jgi:hypothetical protein